MSVNGVRHQASPCGASCFGSLQFVTECAKVANLSANTDSRPPSPAGFMPTDTTIGGCAAARLRVLRVATFGDDAEIAASIVQPVAIDMVTVTAIMDAWQVEQFAMQPDKPPLWLGTIIPAGVPPSQMPLPLACPFSVSGIDYSITSDRSGSSDQRDHGCDTIIAKDDRAPIPSSGALQRAKQPTARLDLQGPSEKVGAALLTDTRNGTLTGHRTLHRSGALPRRCATNVGASCVNYTRLLGLGGDQSDAEGAQRNGTVVGLEEA
jgi:hypothetical protein